MNGKAKFVYSWKLEPTDRLPEGKKPCLSLRELEKQIGYDLDAQMDPTRQSMTVIELVERYLSTKTGVKPSHKSKLQLCEESSESGGLCRKENRTHQNI